MTTDTNLVTGVFTLDYCVKSVLADLEMPKSKGYVRLLKFGVDAFRRLNLAGQLPTVKTVTLDIDPATMTAQLPNDYVSLNKLGVICCGHLINFDVDNNLALKAPNVIDICPCDDEEINTCIDNICNSLDNCNAIEGQRFTDVSDFSAWYYPFYSRWHNGQYTAGFFGYGAGFRRGGYLINLEANIIQFSSCLRNLDQVVLEYISTGIDESGNAIIPQNAIDAICAYIHERYCLNHRDRNVQAMASTWNRKWTNAATSMVKRNEALSYQEWIQLFRTYTYQIPKR